LAGSVLRSALTARRAESAGTSAAARPTFGWHGSLIINSGCGNYQQTLLAVAGNNNRTILAAFEDIFTAVQLETALRSLLAMAA
jgi:hypothetical protein